MGRIINIETADFRWNRLYKLSGAAALISGVLLLIAVVDLIITGFQPAAINGWFALYPDNWLAVIFKLHAGFEDVQPDLLYVLNFLDIALIAFIGTIFIGLYAALRKSSRIWPIVALVQPFLGIALFIATRSAGRSGVMGAGLVISLVMLRSNIFNKVIAVAGILSSVLLLVGDVSVNNARSDIIAALTGIGYMLLIAWLFLIAQRLFELGRGVSLVEARGDISQ
jgi:hypothetical protein